MIARQIYILFFLFQWQWTQASPAPRVVLFTPTGVVKDVSQVQAKFSSNMVKFGDPQGLAPFEIECPENGSGRWLDTKIWVYDFSKNLPAGVECNFKTRNGLKDLDGNLVTSFAGNFSTGGPAIRSASPYQGSTSLFEDQIFIISLDAEPDLSTVSKNAYFIVDGKNERIGVNLVNDSKLRKQILKASYRSSDDPTIVALSAKEKFAPESKVKLVWAKEIQTKNGVRNERDQILEYQVRPPFRIEFSCERENVGAQCLPISPMRIHFSSSLRSTDVAKIVLTGAGRNFKPKEEGPDVEWTSYAQINGPFPPETEFILAIPKDLKDESGRSLENASKFPLKVKTDRYSPLAKFAANFGLIESKSQPLLPVTLRSVEATTKLKGLEPKGKQAQLGPDDLGQILYWMKRVEHMSREKSVFSSSPSKTARESEYESNDSMKVAKEVVPKVTSRDFSMPRKEKPKAFEVVGIPLEKPGFYVVEIESLDLGKSLLGKPEPMFVPATALVTNLSVHLKWGRDSSLVWVTALDSGKPVSGAAVEVRNCKNEKLGTGTSDASGIVRFSGWPLEKSAAECRDTFGYHRYNRGLLASARLGDDFSFVHSSWNEGIEEWRFQVPTEWEEKPLLVHTVFARNLLRAGETVHMKHFLRAKASNGFREVAPKDRPAFIEIINDASEFKTKLPIKWLANGTAESVWKIPEEAKLGAYRIQFMYGKKKYEEGYYAGAFYVQEFRVPLMRATLQPPKDPVVRATEFPVDLSLAYLSGGGAAKQKVKLNRQPQEVRQWTFSEFDDFVFGTGSVQTGTRRTDRDEDSNETNTENKSNQTRDSIEIILDETGFARATVKGLPKKEQPFEVLAELEFKDPNGETQTVANRVPVFPAEQLVGIKLDSWTSGKEDLKLQFAVARVNGKPAAQSQVKVELLERKNYSHRKRLTGGFYAYEHFEEVKNLGPFCEGKTDDRGLLFCQGRSPISGNVVVQASIVDSKGNRSVANREVWIAGEDDWWFKASDNDRMDILPEKKRYEPGDKAKIQVRAPFRQASALVTTEREGILDAFVVEISGKSPVVEVPLKAGTAPNIFVSILAVRGRVGDVQPTALVDLGRPAYKLGITNIQVGWRNHELSVKVKPERENYQVREKVNVSIQVSSADLKPVSSGEVAVAVVDEGLLELLPNKSWQIIDKMMSERAYLVKNSTAQMQVVGRRHFGLKALPPGGGGGNQTTRELFDTLLFWKPAVKLDKNGRAVLSFSLNDSVTAFRIVAVATSGFDKFGTGQGAVKATQDLMILSGIPPLLREGDKANLTTTVRNTTRRSMNVEMKLSQGGHKTTLGSHSIVLTAGEAKEIVWPIQVPSGVTEQSYLIEASEKGGRRDSIRVHSRVIAAVPVKTYQSTIVPLTKSLEIPVQQPLAALSDRGGMRAEFVSKLAGELSGVRDYMSQYPFSCLEQETSRAVSLQDPSLWKKLMKRLPAYLDGDGLAKYFPSMLWGSDVLTAYVLSIAAEVGWEIPEENRSRMVTGLKRFLEGKIARESSLATTDLTVRKLAAAEALSRYPESELKAAMLSGISIEPNLWPTSGLIDWYRLLIRLEDIPNREKQRVDADSILRSRLYFSGTKATFSTEKGDSLWWLMVSTDLNMNRLLSTISALPNWKEDAPKIARAALGRQLRGHWDLTTANAWGVLGVKAFSKNFENVGVTGVTKASLGSRSEQLNWVKTPRGGVFELGVPTGDAIAKFVHEGKGQPWLFLSSRAAIPLKEPVQSGFNIRKTLSTIERKRNSNWSRGDIIRVKVEMSSRSEMTWVALEDPIPSGATLLGSGLARDSQIATTGEKKTGETWPAFEERTFSSFKAYYAWVPKGDWSVEYTYRLNTSGEFSLPQTRVEAMYSPDTFAESPNGSMSVSE